MATSIDTTTLSQLVTDLAFDPAEPLSALQKLGVSPLRRDVDKILQIGGAGAAAFGEGETKKVTDVEVKTVTTKTGKIVSAQIFTEEALNQFEGAELFGNLSVNATRTLTNGLDTLVIHGTDTNDGSVASVFDGAVSKTTHRVDYDGTIEKLPGALASLSTETPNFFSSKVAIAPKLYMQMATARNSLGLPYFTVAGETAEINTRPGLVSPVVQYTNYVDGRSGSGLTDSGALAIAGDWSKIRLYTSPATVRIHREGTFGGVNLLEQNKILLLSELFYTVALDKEDFVVLQKKG